jgi:hypothetical protein
MKGEQGMSEIETGVSYFANRWFHHFIQDLDEIVSHGCTFVVHTFSENDFLFARDTIGRFFRATRDAGLGCWADPWGVMGLFGGEAFSKFVPRNPDACQVLSNGQIVPAACPSAQETRAAMKDWINAALEAGSDTILWDEPHLFIPEWESADFAPQEAWACRCPRCTQRFRSELGFEMPSQLTPELRAFRQNLLLEFLGEMIAYSKAQGANNAVCLLPVGEGSREALPWERVSALPGVDIFGTDPYWIIFERDVEEFVAEQTRKVVAVCQVSGIQPHIWAQAFKVPAGRESEIEVALTTAKAEGATVLAVWGYRGCEALSEIACEQPDVAWETIGRAFSRLRSRQAISS